jgi:hypothetical protein
MGYSIRKFVASLSGFTLAVALLTFFIFSSQVTLAILPVVGTGGVFLQADSFNGENGVVYPQYGQLSPDYPNKNTDTAGCQQRPMLVFQLDAARVDGYTIFKDIKLPYFDERWMSIAIDQSDGSLEAQNGQIKIFTTQLEAGSLALDNVDIKEQNNGEVWGPNSGEFLLRGDPQDSVSGTDLRATGVTAWVHAITGQQINFNSPTGITFDVQYNTTSEIQSRYDNLGILDSSIDKAKRENYFDCLPAQPDVRRNPLLSEDFEGGLPSGWTARNDVEVNSEFSDSGTRSARLGGGNSTLQTPTLDTEFEFDLSVNYFVKMGHDQVNENPDDNEFLNVEFRDERGEWNQIDTYQGGPFSGTLIADDVNGSYSSFQNFDNGGSQPGGWSFLNGADVTTNTSNSGSYSAETGEQDLSRVVSPSYDLSTEREVRMEYWIRKGADSFSEDPDGDEDMFVQYQDSSGDWNTVDFIPADGSVTPDGAIIDRTGTDGIVLPASAYHPNFRVRFIQRAAGGSGFDYWHIDDFRLTRRAFERGFKLPEGAYHSDFALRFRTSGGTDGFDYWHVDDVEIG